MKCAISGISCAARFIAPHQYAIQDSLRGDEMQMYLANDNCVRGVAFGTAHRTAGPVVHIATQCVWFHSCSACAYDTRAGAPSVPQRTRSSVAGESLIAPATACHGTLMVCAVPVGTGTFALQACGTLRTHTAPGRGSERKWPDVPRIVVIPRPDTEAGMHLDGMLPHRNYDPARVRIDRGGIVRAAADRCRSHSGHSPHHCCGTRGGCDPDLGLIRSLFAVE